MWLKRTPGFLKNPGVDFGLALRGCGGGGGGMMTTVLRKHTKPYHHKSRFTPYLQYFRDAGPSLIVTNCTLDFANSTLGFARAFGENSKLGGGKLVFTRYLKYLGHVVVHCCPPFFSSIVAFGGGGVGGGHDDVQAASRTPRTTSKTNPPTLRSGLQGCWRASPMYSWHLCF